MSDFFGALFVGWDVVDADVVTIIGEPQGDGLATGDNRTLDARTCDANTTRTFVAYMPRDEPVTMAVRGS